MINVTATVSNDVQAQATVTRSGSVNATLDVIDYTTKVANKPSINDVTLVGNKTLADLDIASLSQVGKINFSNGEDYPIVNLIKYTDNDGGTGLVIWCDDGTPDGKVIYLYDNLTVNALGLSLLGKIGEVRGAIPTKLSQLNNDDNYVQDSSYIHTDNNFTDAQESKVDALGNWALANEVGGIAKKTSGILFGEVDSTSTSTAFTATVGGFTELYDGLAVYLMNGVVTSASGFTLNINGTGNLPVYSTLSEASRVTTLFNKAYTLLFVYNSKRVEGGCWDAYYGYDSNTNTIGYQLRTNSTVMVVSDTARYYKIYFTSADGTKWVPASSNSTNSATSSKTVNQRPIDPFGRIVYTSAITSYAAGANLAATTIWDQYVVTLGYSFNRTGAALTLTTKAPVYIKCAPQSDGSAIIDADTPFTQALPSTADGKIYIFLGIATSATQVEIVPYHPVYYYANGCVSLWTGVDKVTSGTVANFEIVGSDLIVKDKSGNTHTIAMS